VIIQSLLQLPLIPNNPFKGNELIEPNKNGKHHFEILFHLRRKQGQREQRWHLLTFSHRAGNSMSQQILDNIEIFTQPNGTLFIHQRGPNTIP